MAMKAIREQHTLCIDRAQRAKGFTQPPPPPHTKYKTRGGQNLNANYNRPSNKYIPRPKGLREKVQTGKWNLLTLRYHSFG